MAIRLSPYIQNKPTVASWLNDIPAHWSVRRAKSLFRETDMRSRSGEEDKLSVSHLTGVTLRSEKSVTMFESESPVGQKICDPGDLVINTMWAWMGALGISRRHGIVSPAYGVYRPLSNAEMFPAYADYLLRTRQYIDEYTQRSTGIHSSRLRLYPEVFLGMEILTPPLDEQQAIARFLDRQDRRINRFIRAKRRMIELLNEQKRAIIHQAVTRGLDPSVPLKRSGIGWLGDIPAHWELVRVKDEFDCLNRQRVPLNSPDRGKMVARDYDYYGASGVIDRVEDYIFDDDLLLIAEDGANLVLRNLPLAIIARGKFWVNNHAHILKPKSGSLEYLAHLMESIEYLPWISGAAQPKLTMDRLMAIRIPCPPRTEQDEILFAITCSTSAIRTTIDRTQQEVDLVREYRTRLIADVVTGKLDVRNHPDAQERDEDDVTVLLDDGVDDLTEEFETEEDDDAVAD